MTKLIMLGLLLAACTAEPTPAPDATPILIDGPACKRWECTVETSCGVSTLPICTAHGERPDGAACTAADEECPATTTCKVLKCVETSGACAPARE